MVLWFVGQVHELHNRARKSLATKQILSENFEHDDLPGGVWRTGPTLDVSMFDLLECFDSDEASLTRG